jgi:hypothetical protein
MAEGQDSSPVLNAWHTGRLLELRSILSVESDRTCNDGALVGRESRWQGRLETHLANVAGCAAMAISHNPDEWFPDRMAAGNPFCARDWSRAHQTTGGIVHAHLG